MASKTTRCRPATSPSPRCQIDRPLVLIFFFISFQRSPYLALASSTDALAELLSLHVFQKKAKVMHHLFILPTPQLGNLVSAKLVDDVNKPNPNVHVMRGVEAGLSSSGSAGLPSYNEAFGPTTNCMQGVTNVLIHEVLTLESPIAVGTFERPDLSRPLVSRPFSLAAAFCCFASSTRASRVESRRRSDVESRRVEESSRVKARSRVEEE